ncbi:MAG TPA: IS4 family transposase [Hanamia sp.]
MNTGKYVFSQATDFLSFDDFNKFVKKYKGNYKIKTFSCWNQLLCMLFGQLAKRESLSDLVTCLQTQQTKWYHLGLGTTITNSNLAYANENRDWRMYADFAYTLIAKARKICTASSDFELKIDGNVYAVDSTTIDLCLSVFWWAKFRKHKGAIKLHTQFDIKSDIPHFVHFSDGSVHDVNVMDILIYEPGSFYVFDRGYVDFKRLHNIRQKLAWFVTRAKDNMNYRRLYSNKVDKSTGIKVDQVIKLNNHYAVKNYPDKLRLIKFYDPESAMDLEFISNNFELAATEIAMLYKYRWRIELFFKWIKQHLQIQSFWGTSENAVRIQVYTAIIAYCTVAIMKENLKINHTNYEILQILSMTLISKTPVNQLFDTNYQQNFKELNHNQLVLF